MILILAVSNCVSVALFVFFSQWRSYCYCLIFCRSIDSFFLLFLFMSDVSDLQTTIPTTSRFFALLLLKMAEAEIFALAEAVRKHPQENITKPKLRWKSSSHFQASFSSAATNQQDDCQYMASVYPRTHLYFLQKSTCRLTKWKKCVVSTHEKLIWSIYLGSRSRRREPEELHRDSRLAPQK